MGPGESAHLRGSLSLSESESLLPSRPPRPTSRRRHRGGGHRRRLRRPPAGPGRRALRLHAAGASPAPTSPPSRSHVPNLAPPPPALSIGHPEKCVGARPPPPLPRCGRLRYPLDVLSWPQTIPHAARWCGEVWTAWMARPLGGGGRCLLFPSPGQSVTLIGVGEDVARLRAGAGVQRGPPLQGTGQSIGDGMYFSFIKNRP